MQPRITPVLHDNLAKEPLSRFKTRATNIRGKGALARKRGAQQQDRGSLTWALSQKRSSPEMMSPDIHRDETLARYLGFCVEGAPSGGHRHAR